MVEDALILLEAAVVVPAAGRDEHLVEPPVVELAPNRRSAEVVRKVQLVVAEVVEYEVEERGVAIVEPLAGGAVVVRVRLLQVRETRPTHLLQRGASGDEYLPADVQPDEGGAAAGGGGGGGGGGRGGEPFAKRRGRVATDEERGAERGGRPQPVGPPGRGPGQQAAASAAVRQQFLAAVRHLTLVPMRATQYHRPERRTRIDAGCIRGALARYALACMSATLARGRARAHRVGERAGTWEPARLLRGTIRSARAFANSQQLSQHRARHNERRLTDVQLVYSRTPNRHARRQALGPSGHATHLFIARRCLQGEHTRSAARRAVVCPPTHTDRAAKINRVAFRRPRYAARACAVRTAR